MATAVKSMDVDTQMGSTFIDSKDVIEAGDTVIIYLNHTTSYAVKVQHGKTLNMKYGALRHEFIIGKRYGTPISATAGYVYALRATPELWTRTLSRQTQILYTPDISLILMLLDARPGSVICETGTGSGSLSHAIATAIAPGGHLYTHDIDEGRVKKVEQELKEHGLFGCTTVIQQDTCEDGFFVENACDGVFLDLPAPWKAVPHAKRAISSVRGGRIVSFSPCIEQVQKFTSELELQGFIQVQTVEIVPRKLKVITTISETLQELDERSSSHPTTQPSANNGNGDPKDGDSTTRAKKRKVLSSDRDEDALLDSVPFPSFQPTHTGYLTSATLLPSLIE